MMSDLITAAVLFATAVLMAALSLKVRGPSSYFGAAVAAIFALAAIILLTTALAQSAHARDLDGRYAQSPLKPWFDQLRSKGGALCCSDADGVAVSDPDWDTDRGHYRVKIDGAWMDVPDEAVVIVPNRAGKTMVWPYYADGKVKFIRCFMPGEMS